MEESKIEIKDSGRMEIDQEEDGKQINNEVTAQIGDENPNQVTKTTST